MRPIIVLTVLALSATPAFADDRGSITTQMQEMADALVPGDAAVWDKYLDANVIYAEEDDTYKGKAEAIKELQPLPKGLGGTIKIEATDISAGSASVTIASHFSAIDVSGRYARTRARGRSRSPG